MAQRPGTQVLKDGHPRRLSDGRNAWRKMNGAQRFEFLVWIAEQEGGQVEPTPRSIRLGIPRESVR